MSRRVDTNNWRKKVRAVSTAEALVVKEAVDWGLDLLMKTTVKNVSGPHYGFERRKSKRGDGEVEIPIRGPLTNAGKLPVPVVYGMLRRSIKMVRFNPVLGAVYADHNVAPYATYVHDGTRYMQPRRYLQDAVTGMRPIIKRKAEKLIKDAIGKVGKQ